MERQRREQKESNRVESDDAWNVLEDDERDAYRETYDFEPPRELPGKKCRRETW